MVQIERLLVPTDFSEASSHALPHALEIARKFKAEVIMIHVRTPFPGSSGQPEHEFFDGAKYEAYVERELEERSKEAGPEIQIRTAVKHNISAASGILEFAQENDMDMVVMGTHGGSALAHFFLGSVAEKVVRYSPVPVLTVAPSRSDYRQDAVYKRILVPFDFSKHSRDAAKSAKLISDRYGARLQVVYVIEQEVLPGHHRAWKESVSRDAPELAAEAEKALVDGLGEAGIHDVEVCVEVGTGDGKAHTSIVRFAKDHEADLIVMGTHGLSGFERMLLGSTTERVVRIAPCPVLTLHLHNAEAEDS